MARLYLYKRGPKPTYYIGGYPTGRKQRSTGLTGPANQEKAEQLLAEEQERIARLVATKGPLGPMTVERWAKKWLEERQLAGAPTSAHVDRLGNHILPAIGRAPLAEVTHEHVAKVLRVTKTRGIIRRTRASGLAPRTRRNVLVTMKMLFAAAVPALLKTAPDLKKIDRALMPENMDHDPEWRAQAVFTRPEVEQLIFNDNIPDDRRVLYALLFLAGLRVGEAAALRLRSWTADYEPLGMLLVAYTYSSRKGVTKRVKMNVTRKVPLHPVLAQLLRLWLAPGGGWEQMIGRRPTPEDLIVPSRLGDGKKNRSSSVVLQRFKQDLKRLGLRDRRVHDTRRTFISLTMANEGHKDLLRWVTHGRASQDAFDDYMTPPWAALCREVCRLEVSRPEPAADVLPIRKYAISHGRHLQATYKTEKPKSSRDIERDQIRSGWTLEGTDSPEQTRTLAPPEKPGPEKTPRSPGAPDRVSRQRDTSDPHVCRAVSAVSEALAALEKGDVDRAKAVLRRAV